VCASYYNYLMQIVLVYGVDSPIQSHMEHADNCFKYLFISFT